MEVRHKETGLVQNLSKEDWAKLVETKHAENFEITKPDDFTPPESKTNGTPSEAKVDSKK